MVYYFIMTVERHLMIRSFLRPLIGRYYRSGGYDVVGTNRNEKASLTSQLGHVEQLSQPSKVRDSVCIETL